MGILYNFPEDIEKYGLTQETYEQLLNDCTKRVARETDDDWIDICNRYNLNFNFDTVRKGAQPPLIGSAFVSEYYKWKESKNDVIDNDKYLKELEVKKRELERKKIQFRDERFAWQRQNYSNARLEEKLDYLAEELTSIGRTNFKTHNVVVEESNNDLLVILSDFHIGQTFNSAFGEYNSDIARDRLEQLLNEVLSIARLHKSQNCYVSLQGDMISGNIHKSVQVTNRENVIQQVKMATELISSFCYELTSYFDNVFMSSIVGNHSRIDTKEDAIHDERLDDIISWAVGLSLAHISNFHVKNNNIDTGIADIVIRGKHYVSVHGDMDQFNRSGVQNLCLALGFIPYAVTYGHMHCCAVDEVNGIKMIRGGSLAGSGDTHTIEKRLTGKASQMVCVCTEKGVKAYYPIELD